MKLEKWGKDLILTLRQNGKNKPILRQPEVTSSGLPFLKTEVNGQGQVVQLFRIVKTLVDEK